MGIIRHILLAAFIHFTYNGAIVSGIRCYVCMPVPELGENCMDSRRMISEDCGDSAIGCSVIYLPKSNGQSAIIRNCGKARTDSATGSNECKEFQRDDGTKARACNCLENNCNSHQFSAPPPSSTTTLLPTTATTTDDRYPDDDTSTIDLCRAYRDYRRSMPLSGTQQDLNSTMTTFLDKKPVDIQQLIQRKSITEWTVDDLRLFATSLTGMDIYGGLFRIHEIDGSAALLFTRTDWQQAGFRMGPALKLQHAVQFVRDYQTKKFL